MVIPVSPIATRTAAEARKINAARLYRRDYEHMNKQLSGGTCGAWDWRTLALVSPTWYATLQSLWYEVQHA